MHARPLRAARVGIATALVLALIVLLPGHASGQPPIVADDSHSVGITDDPARDADLQERFEAARLDQAQEPDAVADAAVTGLPHRPKERTLRLRGRGERFLDQGTTDVWAHNRHAYIGTSNVPCGTGESFAPGEQVDLIDDVEAPGVAVFSVRNVNRPRDLGNMPSLEGSRINDVKVDRLNSGDILVHSNEPCTGGPGGPGGVEIYDVSNPAKPVHQASIRLDEINEVTPFFFAEGALEDVGVHNLFIYTQGDRDFVSLVYNGVFHTFRTFDITDPTNPELVNAWGAEELFDAGVGDTTLETDPTGERTLAAVQWLLDGFGTSRNRFLHDITVDESGTRAFLSNWDAGLVLLDISDITDPQVVSVALEPEAGSLDGEVNSHAAWPSEDGTIVVETEEDFDHIRLAVNVADGPLAGESFGAFEDNGAPPPPLLSDVGVIEEDAVWVGRLCIGDPVENEADFEAGDVAVVRRGECAFSEKLVNAEDLGASAVLVANNLPGQPGVANGTFGGLGGIPGLFISTDAGDAFEANQLGNTVVLDPDEITFDPWGGVRVWDYSDPANPVLASTFDTVCSADDVGNPACELDGTYSVHNVVVETQGNRVLAYLSWYWDGMIVLDVTDPYGPVEVARFFDNSPEFIEANGGRPHDFWGVWKIPNRPTIYGADRNGGLYTFQLTGRGR